MSTIRSSQGVNIPGSTSVPMSEAQTDTQTTTVEVTQPASTVSDTQFEAASDAQTSQPLPGHLMTGQPGQPVARGQSLFSMALNGFQSLPSDGQSLYTLQNGPAMGAVGLNDVLSAIPQTPEGQATIQGLLANIEAQTGVAVPDAMVDVVMRDPSKISDLLHFQPADLKRGVSALNLREPSEANDAGGFQLPASVDMAQLGSLDIPVPEPELKELASGLWQGSVKSDLPEAQAKTNVAMAGVFDKLAANGSDGQDFSVTYQGESFSRLDDFLEALQKDGHTIEVGVEQRVANFLPLKTQGPGGQLIDVPSPLFVRTGVTDADGNEASVPALHSELTIKIRKGDNTEGPGFDADLKWYQGTEGTGFFPDKLTQSSPWTGSQHREIGQGADAIEAVKLAGMFSDSVNQAADEQNLWLSGYGATGVCNDSVAVIEHAMTGRNLTYPLFMSDEALLPELTERMAAGSADSASYQRLIDSVNTLPSDDTPNASAQTRAAHSLPWAEGQEPFVSTADARRILNQ